MKVVVKFPALFSKDVENDELRFGDEIECAIMVVDKDAKTVKLSIRSAEVTLLLLLIHIS